MSATQRTQVFYIHPLDWNHPRLCGGLARWFAPQQEAVMTANGTVGAFPPPPGVTPNFHNPESIAYRVIVASVLGPVVAIPLCILRLYSKRYVLRNTGYDDCEYDVERAYLVQADVLLDAIALATVGLPC
jgi:hypothetical protein